MDIRLFALIVFSAVTLGSSGCKRNSPGETQSKIKDGSDSANAGALSQAASESSFASDWKFDFLEVTELAGVNAVYHNGEESNNFSIVESLGGGVGTLDFDLDGRPDLIFPGGGEIQFQGPLTGLPISLYRSLGGLRFKNVTDPSGVGNTHLYSHGVAAADFDADGFPDFLITGYGKLQFFHNNGDGTFTEVASLTGLENNTWSSSAAFADLDNDGLLDLYLVNYVNWSWENNPQCAGLSPMGRDVCTPQVFDGVSDSVYWNCADGTFKVATQTNGLVPAGKGLGVISCDFNQDSLIDLYVANDTTNNFLYLNEGNRNLRESGIISGTALNHLGIPNGSMGIAIYDHDHDLLSDLFVANYERETFAIYRNEGKGNFRCISERTGITALGTLYVGFGATSGDFNCDGSEEIVVANGHVMRYPKNDNLKQVPLLLRNDTEGKIHRLQFDITSYFSNPHTGRGVIAVDLDGDQMQDLVFSNTNQKSAILHNTSPVSGRSVSLRLVGTRSNRDAIGARAVLQTNGGKYLRQVFGGGSYLSQGPYELHWGIPNGDSPVSVEIVWPDGTKQMLNNLVAGNAYTVIQD